MLAYLDNSATTRPTDGVIDAMSRCMREGYFNPSSLYAPAIDSEKAMRACREELASALCVSPKGIFFTSGGTEANNLAIIGTVSAMRGPQHLIVSAVEHPSVLEAFHYLEGLGHRVTVIGVDGHGQLDWAQLENALSDPPALVSCMQVNNEQGSLSTAEKTSRLEADLSSLKPFPGNLGCFEVYEYIVDKWSTISMKNVHYSVPDSLVGEKVHVKVYSEKIVILYGKEKVASHQRSYCGGDWCIKLEHYLRTLSRKPGALPHSVVWQRAPEELRRLYDIHFKEDNRTFVLLLDYARKNGFSGTDIVTACKELTGRGVRKISPDQVKAMLHGSVQGETEETMEPPVLPAQQENIEREAVDMLEGITALMTGYNEVHDIIPTI